MFSNPNVVPSYCAENSTMDSLAKVLNDYITFALPKSFVSHCIVCVSKARCDKRSVFVLCRAMAEALRTVFFKVCQLRDAQWVQKDLPEIEVCNAFETL